MTFKDLNITEPILKAIEEKGYANPTPIQVKAIPAALTGKDILGCAQTGTGKTAAFAIPIIQHLQALKNRDKSIKTLILTPTRELAFANLQCQFTGRCQYQGFDTLIPVFKGLQMLNNGNGKCGGRSRFRSAHSLIYLFLLRRQGLLLLV